MTAVSVGDLAGEDLCYVTTTGRHSGREHTIEIWFVVRGASVYILMGGGEKADTVRNLRANRDARVRIGGRTWQGTGRVVTDDAEAAFVRHALPAKYAAHEDGLEAWAATALPVAIDIAG